MTDKTFDFPKIVANFQLEGTFLRAEPCGCGHINDTFTVYFQKENGCSHRYILQRINNKIFTNVDKLMENIQGVISHLRRFIMANNGDPNREVLTLLSTRGGTSYWYDSEADNYWRAYNFIEGTITYQNVEKPEHFYNSAKGFGKFQKMMADYPIETLYEIIPNFHNTAMRFRDFEQAVQNDVAGRASQVQAEIDFAMARKEDACVLVNLLENGVLPIRVTHNDTKLNNVMFDEVTGKDLCVIDYDTIMPGLSLYDFGDSIRFGANPAAEDERDLSKVRMELSLFEQYVKGYLEEADLTESELANLSLSAKIISFETGIRFLADHLNGDTYFKVHRENHNLDRCRTQFKLVADMEQKLTQMNTIVEKYKILNKNRLKTD